MGQKLRLERISRGRKPCRRGRRHKGRHAAWTPWQLPSSLAQQCGGSLSTNLTLKVRSGLWGIRALSFCSVQSISLINGHSWCKSNLWPLEEQNFWPLLFACLLLTESQAERKIASNPPSLIQWPYFHSKAGPKPWYMTWHLAFCPSTIWPVLFYLS